MRELEIDTVESSELVEQTFKFWFSDNEHIRSPFPNYIHSELKIKATDLFFQWAKGINPEAKDELNDEMIGEKFEEIIFETALSLIKTEDERITILYPFLPRLDDKIKSDSGADSKIIDRELTKESDHSFMKVKMKDLNSDTESETKFELPFNQ